MRCSFEQQSIVAVISRRRANERCERRLGRVLRARDQIRQTMTLQLDVAQRAVFDRETTVDTFVVQNLDVVFVFLGVLVRLKEASKQRSKLGLNYISNGENNHFIQTTFSFDCLPCQRQADQPTSTRAAFRDPRSRFSPPAQ